MSKQLLVSLLVFGVLLADQALKIYVKLNFNYGEEVQLFGLDRVLIHFVENDGMAFGFTFGGNYGKLLLSLFRSVAVVFLSLYLIEQIKQGVHKRLLVAFALILAGALGNIIDSAFYGLVFSPSYHDQTAILFPEGGGYAPFLYGRVVDMIYLPLFYGSYPDWFPLIGGNNYLFFKPVFNLADVAISTGVAVLLYDQFGTLLSNRKNAANKVQEEE